MFTRFFIDRPIFASVVSIVIVIAGGVTLPFLPIEQLPNITPPTVEVSTMYPGANAQVVADTVTTPIEEQVNGVDNMLYMSSKSSSDGRMSLTVTFEVGTDIDMSTVLVQNRVAIAEPKLPEEVKRQGVTVKKKSTNIVLLVNLVASDGRYDEIYLSNYASRYVKDELSRVLGVGEVQILGSKDFGMRIWLNPNQLASRNLTTTEVLAAIREQNVQVAAGQIGQPPSPVGQEFQYTISATGRLTDKEQFENIIVKTGEDGRLVRVRDVARVELGAENYDWSSQLDSRPAASIAIYQLPGANALNVAEGIKAKMKELGRAFPEGLESKIVYDSTLFVSASIKEVVVTLFIAFVLVFLSVYIFLQDIRATLVPALTIPVSLIGTFGVMMLLGFSINTLTLFGLILVIGIVVDDAIVVVENTIRILDEGKLATKDATKKAMEEVTGPIIATTLVLLAVFVPTAFLGGITGQFYKQFALTIATATVFSSINALTLSPALCGILLRPTRQKHNWFFRGFNWGFAHTTTGYMAAVKRTLWRPSLMMVLLAGVVGLTVYGFRTVPGGFIPDEDQGYLFVNVQLPDAASMERTEKIVDRMNKILADTPGVANVVSLSGYSLLDTTVASNLGCAIVTLEPWEERKTEELQLPHILGSLSKQFNQIEEAVVFAFIPPAIQGLGQSGGFQFQLEDRGDVGLETLQNFAADLVEQAGNQPQTGRREQHLPRQCPPTVRRRRPRQGQTARRALECDLRDPSGQPRVGLRQRLQQDRPGLQGHGPGRPAVPKPRRRYQPAEGADPRRKNGSAKHPGQGRRHRRTADDQPLQPLSHRPDHRFRRNGV